MTAQAFSGSKISTKGKLARYGRHGEQEGLTVATVLVESQRDGNKEIGASAMAQ